MYTGKTKKFRDTIHGYIEIPNCIVKYIIDTELFQRLRYIEQTSMRPLYPAARHDRFIHSLGVYWLGKQAFFYFRKNALLELENAKEQPDEKWWDKQELLFNLACLLHDCAHAPYSHTLEELYSLRKITLSKKTEDIESLKAGSIISELDYQLLRICSEGDSDFVRDFFDTDAFEKKGVGAPHEKMSAFCVMNEFKNAIQNIADDLYENKIIINDEDYVFIVRMIIGAAYTDTRSGFNSLKNCIISMLNSASIDVDGLDYIVRDAYMSGIDNFSIDYQRLLSSFTLISIDTFDKVCVTKQDLNGIWLKDSRFQITALEQGFMRGKMVFEGIDSELSSIDIIGDNKAITNGVLSTEINNEIRVHSISSSTLLLCESCTLSGIFSGEIEHGRRLVSKMHQHSLENGYREYMLGYDKTSLSIIQSTLEARNLEYLWVYTHPKVLYSSNYLQWELLRFSAHYLCCCNNKTKDFDKKALDFSMCGNCEHFQDKNIDSEEDFLLYILGFETYFPTMPKRKYSKLINKGFSFHRTCDDDLNALFKRIRQDNQARKDLKSIELEDTFKEFFSRNHRKVLWKSFVEYDNFLKEYDTSDRTIIKLLRKTAPQSSLYKNNYGKLQPEEEAVFNKYGMEDVLIVKAKVKTKQLNPHETFIKFKNDTLRLCDVFDQNIIKGKMNKEFYYLFANFTKEVTDSDLRSLIKNLQELQ